MFKAITTAAALSLIAIAAPAAAKTEAVSVTVNLDNFDLTTPTGLEALEKRFAGRVNLACGRADMKSRASVRAVKQCRASLSEKVAIAIAEIAENPTRFAQVEQITVRS